MWEVVLPGLAGWARSINVDVGGCASWSNLASLTATAFDGGDSSGLLDAWAQVGTEDEQVLTSSHGGGEEGGEALIDGHGHGGGGGHEHESHNIFAIPSGGKQQFFWA